MPLYQLYELNHAAISPARTAADLCRVAFQSPLNPISYTPIGRGVSAVCEMFERATRRYDKPEFGIESVDVGGASVAVSERTVWRRPFCRLQNFAREGGSGDPQTLDRCSALGPLRDAAARHRPRDGEQSRRLHHRLG